MEPPPPFLHNEENVTFLTSEYAAALGKRTKKRSAWLVGWLLRLPVFG